MRAKKQTREYTDTVAAKKSKVYFQDAEPTGGTYLPGDTWFDTDNDNRIYEWSGSAWVAVQFGENAIADLAITDAKIANATISSAKISNLDAGKITTGTLNAARVAIGSGTTFASGYDPTLIDIGARNYVPNSKLTDKKTGWTNWYDTTSHISGWPACSSNVCNHGRHNL